MIESQTPINIYINIIPEICKYDLIRVLYLYKYGGIYVDFDILCLRSMDELIMPDDEFIVGLESNKIIPIQIFTNINIIIKLKKNTIAFCKFIFFSFFLF